jgi:N-acetylglucosaminyldiphosphoundecaprenol N-acetyl-beta-D-mannosaminyltransferase
MPAPTAIPILGVPVHAVTADQALTLVEGYMAAPRLHQIATVNPEFVMAAQTDAAFRHALRTADLCLPDGVGLLYAARRWGRSLPERVPGSEFVYALAERAAACGWPLFLLGAAPGVAEEAARIFEQRYPGLPIAGTYAGSPDPAENDAIVRRINDSGASLLYVAYGAPKQDKWIERNRHTLTTVRVAMGVGGSLDFVTGRAVRAPRWAQERGLEWLYRLYKEPWRWRRMLALPKFAMRVLLSDELELRAARGSREQLLAILAKAPDVEPEEYDRLDARRDD